MVRDRRKPSDRVAFEPPRSATILSVDGTWSCPCRLLEISETGAHLAVSVALPATTLTEFFLLLTSTGSVYRRCAFASLHAGAMDVVFLKARASAPMMLSFDMIAPERDSRPDPGRGGSEFPVGLAVPAGARSDVVSIPA